VGDLGVIVAFAPGAGAAVEDEGGHVVFLSLVSDASFKRAWRSLASG
jgi:hypothetical protein